MPFIDKLLLPSQSALMAKSKRVIYPHTDTQMPPWHKVSLKIEANGFGGMNVSDIDDSLTNGVYMMGRAAG